MKKKILITFISILFLKTNGISQTNSIQYIKDSLKIEQLNTKIDSLIKITSDFKIEESYFTTALNSQTVIFSIIITITLFLFGLVQYFNMKIEIRKYKNQSDIKIIEQNQIIDNIKIKSETHNVLINKVLGNLNVLIAEIYKDDEKTYFRFLLSAAKFQNSNNYISTACVNLKKCYEFSKKDNFNEILISLKNKESNIEEDLNSLINSDNKEIKRLSLFIYSRYLDVKNKIKESKIINT